MSSSILTAAVACLAMNVYHEARGEPAEGQLAVAHVTLNRVADPAYPSDVCGVVWQRKQFSWTDDGKSDAAKDEAALVTAANMAVNVINGHAKDPTGGATHYHNDKVSPRWASRLKATATIGSHTFYKETTDGTQ